ncbi:MAG: inorganic phosphate transporter [Candidatus Eisenbacteria bacterium]|nr:inorganic phosphate transporter [Candidatus Eisenbacteria bacterium]
MSLGLIVVCALILGSEFVNGWTDAPNAIATVVSTRALTPRQAVLMAACLNFVGVLSGTAVAKTVGQGIVNASAIDLTTLGSAMVGIIFWSSLAARYGLPTSESHALVAGLAGAGMATAGPSVLLSEGWRKVGMGLVFSTVLGFTVGIIVILIIYRICGRMSRSRVMARFRWLQVFSSAFVAFSHGSNDGQKFMGPFSLALVMGGVLPVFRIPLWVMALCAITMGVGTAVGGWRIIRTLGMRLTHLDYVHGFAAETAAASTIEFASRLGIPLSTTHTVTTSILGVGVPRGLKAVRWGVTMNVVSAWLLTFPVCGLIGWGAVKIVRFFEGLLI